MDTPVQFKIKNYKALACFEFVDKAKHAKVYEYLEKIVLQDDVDNDLLNMSPKEYVDKLKDKFKDTVIKKNNEETTKLRRKNIKDVMIENYVIKNNKDEKFLKALNIKLFFKTLNTKNIIVEDGDIIDLII